MTVTTREKRCDVRTSHNIMSVASNLINKQNATVESKFSTSPVSCCAKNVGEDYRPMTLPTPEDSTASWLDAEDSYQVTDFLDEASRILHNEEDFSDACHDRLRSEYEQWKRIPHLRIIGKRIEYSSAEMTLEDDKQSCHVDSRPSTANNGDLDLLRDQVIKIMTETLWQRLLDKTSIKSVCQRQSMLEPRRISSGRIESALIVSSILPANRPSIMFKSRSNLETVSLSGPVYQQQNNKKYNKNTWPKNNDNVLPPIETHQMKKADKKKRWFSAVNTPGRNHALPRPVTSVATRVNTSINVCFDISIDGKSIKSLKKRGYCSPS